MSTSLVLLAALMAAVTYPSRALPLLAPRLDRLPDPTLRYLRLVGPATLAALAAVNTAVGPRHDGLQLGIAWPAVALCVAISAWRHSLLLGICAAVALTASARALGLG